MEGCSDEPQAFSVNVGPRFTLGDFLHAAIIVNPSVDQDPEVYLVRGHTGDRVRWVDNEIRQFGERFTSKDHFVICESCSFYQA